MGLLDATEEAKSSSLGCRRQATTEDLDRMAFRGLLDATTADFAVVNLMYSLYATIRVSRPSEAAYLSQLDVNGNRRQRVEHCQQSLQCREQSASIRRSDEDERARR